MTTKTSKTTIIAALSAMLVLTVSFPASFAHDTPIDSWWWENGDAEMCYLSSELDDLSLEGLNNAGFAFEDQFDDSVSHYNSETGLSISAQSGACNDPYIEVGSYNDGYWGNLAEIIVEAIYPVPNDDYRKFVEIDFNTEKDFGNESATCNWDDWDPEWVMNHELGHAVGMEHHSHTTATSVMYPWCASTWEELQTDDLDALETRY